MGQRGPASQRGQDEARRQWHEQAQGILDEHGGEALLTPWQALVLPPGVPALAPAELRKLIGASDARAEAPADGHGISPDDVAASIYHSLGIDARAEYRTPTGRPVAIVRNGTIVKGLFA